MTCVNISIVDDSVQEETENFHVVAYTLDNNGDLTSSRATIYIRDNDG